MLALQQARAAAPERHMSDASRYTEDEYVTSTLKPSATNLLTDFDRNTYVPPRQAWNQNTGRNSPRLPSPLSNAAGPAELPTNLGNAPSQPSMAPGEYYEDVDPRFAEPPPAQRPATNAPLAATANSYEDIPPGSRSPAPSDRSNFTSISQRPINPRWNPNPPGSPPPIQGGGYGNGPVPRRPTNQATNLILDSNPDFQVPLRGPASRPGP